MRKFLLLTAAVLLATPAAAVNLIANGGFEADPNPGAFTNRIAGETTLTGWTIESGSIDHIGTYWNAASGTRSIDLNGGSPGVISQTIATIIGRSYTFSFNFSGNPDSGITKTMDFQVGSQLGNTSYSNASRPLEWVPFSFNYIADSTSTVIRFTGTNAGPWGMALDDVSFSPGAIPEPASWAMLLAGFGLVGFAARRRRRTVTA